MNSFLKDFILLLVYLRMACVSSLVAVGDRKSAMAKSVKLSLLLLSLEEQGEEDVVMGVVHSAGIYVSRARITNRP